MQNLSGDCKLDKRLNIYPTLLMYGNCSVYTQVMLLIMDEINFKKKELRLTEEIVKRGS
jgi:hypothetical protein